MIKAITKADLPSCIEIFHNGYESVAIEFGLTLDNCPDRGRSRLPLSKLISEFENGVMMFGYYYKNELIGYLGLKIKEKTICKINDIIILSEHRNKGYGKELLDFAKSKAKEFGATKISLGMIDDNKTLKNWYIANGFMNVGYKKFDKAPYIVGYMECVL